MTAAPPSSAVGPADRARLQRFAALSIVAAVVTITMKLVAWRLTSSVGLLSDALESLVNLVAAVLALLALRYSARPADANHAYGHAKVEYVAAGVEGALVLLAAVTIAWASVMRFVHPHAVDHVGPGLVVSLVATLVNLGVGAALIREGARHRSLALEADGRHLITDVWTSLGVVVGVVLVAATDVERLDPTIGVLVALNVVVAGVRLVRRSAAGLLDEALPPDQLRAITRVLEGVRADGFEYHALRTRASGYRSFVSVHVLVPGSWTVRRGHTFVEDLEERLRHVVPSLTVETHLEPLGDAASFQDVDLVD